MTDAVLAIDAGTTSNRAILFGRNGEILGNEGLPLEQHFPADGWVEHDPEEIVEAVIVASRAVMRRDHKIVAIGITNQRETTILWDRRTGKALHRAIVWQDRRTADLCEQLRREGREPEIQKRTGLVLDPYFSGTKLAWLLNRIPGARERAAGGELAFGTVDSWLVFRLTGGQLHATDATNASRTMLYDIRRNAWDEEILRWLDIPAAVLPRVLDSAADCGMSDERVLGARIPILGVVGDQQAATIGQACFSPGDAKATYGTGCFLLANTGAEPPRSKARLLGTIAYKFGGETTYALEGSTFMAGAILEWLKSAGLAASASEVPALAERANTANRCILVPGFVGLGAPYWAPQARGAILGMTRDTGAPEIAAAALDAVAFQTRDLLEAVLIDAGVAPQSLRIDGGMTRSDLFCQRLADITGAVVERAHTPETTAFGAACAAMLGAGLLKGLAEIAAMRASAGRFTPRTSLAERDARYAAWLAAVRRTL